MHDPACPHTRAQHPLTRREGDPMAKPDTVRSRRFSRLHVFLAIGLAALLALWLAGVSAEKAPGRRFGSLLGSKGASVTCVLGHAGKDGKDGKNGPNGELG